MRVFRYLLVLERRQLHLAKRFGPKRAFFSCKKGYKTNKSIDVVMNLYTRDSICTILPRVTWRYPVEGCGKHSKDRNWVLGRGRGLSCDSSLTYLCVLYTYYQCDLLHRHVTECVVVCEWSHLLNLDSHNQSTRFNKWKRIIHKLLPMLGHIALWPLTSQTWIT